MLAIKAFFYDRGVMERQFLSRRRGGLVSLAVSQQVNPSSGRLLGRAFDFEALDLAYSFHLYYERVDEADRRAQRRPARGDYSSIRTPMLHIRPSGTLRPPWRVYVCFTPLPVFAAVTLPSPDTLRDSPALRSGAAANFQVAVRRRVRTLLCSL